MAKVLARYEINHNDIGDIERGPWRKYNPYNPYVPGEEKEKKVDDLKIESLDDLFEEEKTKKPEIDLNNKEPDFSSIFDGFNDFEEKDSFNIKQEMEKQLNGVKEEPTNEGQANEIIEKLTNEEQANDVKEEFIKNEEEYDLQKELEAKFDELFGPIDDD